MLVSISDSAREAGKQKAFGLIIFAQNQYRGYTLHLKFDEASLFLPRTANFPSPFPRNLGSHIAICKDDAEAVLRLMNSTGRLVVPSLLCSTAALTLCSKVSSSSCRSRLFLVSL